MSLTDDNYPYPDKRKAKKFAKACASEWAKCNDTDMAHTCFDFYLNNSKSGLGQVSMISTVNIGSAKELFNALEQIDPDEGSFSISMGVDFVYPCPPF